MLLVVALLAASAQAEDSPQPIFAHSEQRPILTSHLFAFHSDPEIQLHHFLYRWAEIESQEAGGGPRGERFFRPSDRDKLDELADGERAIWQAGIDFYRQHVIQRNLLFDRGLVGLRDILADKRPRRAGSAGALSEADAAVLARIDACLPVYRRVWWPEHDRASHEWVAAVAPPLVRHELAIAERIASAYGRTWPSPPNRIDVSVYSNRTSAYTTSEPHTVISAANPGLAPPWDLELLFHESSHSNELEQGIHAHIRRAYEGLDAEPPRNLWHILLFATAGEATRLERVAAGDADYTPYAFENEVFHHNEVDRRAWQVVKKHWIPAIAHRQPLASVIGAIASELSARASPAVQDGSQSVGGLEHGRGVEPGWPLRRRLNEP